MKKRLVLFIVSIGFFSSCLIENTKINLVSEKGENILLLDEDDIRISVFARLNERFNSDKNSINNKGALTISISVNEFNSLRVKYFSIIIKEKSNDTFEKNVNGTVSFVEEMLDFSKSTDIKNHITNVIFKPQTYPLNTMFYIKTEESNRSFISNEFIIETNLLFELNKKEYSINKKDTLYRKVIKKTQLRVH